MNFTRILKMNYFSSTFFRFLIALSTLKFWTKGTLILFLSGIGIWWPYIFNWSGYENILSPEPWFTYGLATLMIIVGERLFMKEAEDNYIMPNRFILFLLAIVGGILFGKSVTDHIASLANSQF